MDSLCNYEGNVGPIDMHCRARERVMENRLIRRHDEVARYGEERHDFGCGWQEEKQACPRTGNRKVTSRLERRGRRHDLLQQGLNVFLGCSRSTINSIPNFGCSVICFHPPPGKPELK